MGLVGRDGLIPVDGALWYMVGNLVHRLRRT